MKLTVQQAVLALIAITLVYAAALACAAAKWRDFEFYPINIQVPLSAGRTLAEEAASNEENTAKTTAVYNIKANRPSPPITKPMLKADRVARVDLEDNTSQPGCQMPDYLDSRIIKAISHALLRAETAVFMAIVAFCWILVAWLRRRRLSRFYELPWTEPQIDR